MTIQEFGVLGALIVGGVNVLNIVFGWVGKLLARRSKRANADLVAKASPITREHDGESALPFTKKSSFFTAFVIMLSTLGLGYFAFVSFAIVTTFPQLPFGEPVPEWVAVLAGAPVFCLLLSYIWIRLSCMLQPDEQPKRLRTEKDVIRVIILMTLWLAGAIYFFYFDPFGLFAFLLQHR